MLTPTKPVDYKTMTDAAGLRCFSITTRCGAGTYAWNTDAAAAEKAYDAWVATLPVSVDIHGRAIPQRAARTRKGPARIVPGC